MRKLNPTLSLDYVLAKCGECMQTGRRPLAYAWLKRPTPAMYALTLDLARLRRILAYRAALSH